MLEALVRNTHHDVSEHVDQSSVGIPCEAGIVSRGRESDHGDVVQTEVEDGVHHPGHRDRGAGTDRHEKRVLGAAEFLALFLLEKRDVALDFIHQPGRKTARPREVRAGHGGDGESGGHGKADRSHVREIGALASEEHLLLGGAIGLAGSEVVTALLRSRLASG